ncbi:MAG: hypothetical protein IPP94_13930 [Ignavibacteria bacterium]|nr:hypothetical protein [Ignavibacteria bacterium]
MEFISVPVLVDVRAWRPFSSSAWKKPGHEFSKDDGELLGNLSINASPTPSA